MAYTSRSTTAAVRRGRRRQSSTRSRRRDFVPAGSSPECAPGGRAVDLRDRRAPAPGETVRARSCSATTSSARARLARVTSTTPETRTRRTTARPPYRGRSRPPTCSIDKSGPATVDRGRRARLHARRANDGPSDATGVTVDRHAAARHHVRVGRGLHRRGADRDLRGRRPRRRRATRTFDAPRRGPGRARRPDARRTARPSPATRAIPIRANNTDTAQTNVGPAVDLKIVKTRPARSPAAPSPGRSRCRNGGPSTATDVQVADELPAGVTFTAATAGQGTCAPRRRTSSAARSGRSRPAAPRRSSMTRPVPRR